MNTHKALITISTGETLFAEFSNFDMAKSWCDNIVSMRGINPDSAVITEIDTREAQTQIAWAAADAFALAAVDRNERERYLGWLSDPNCSQDRKNKILAVLEWLDAIWGQYYTIKTRIASGRKGVFNPDVLPPCPHSFFDIAST